MARLTSLCEKLFKDKDKDKDKDTMILFSHPSNNMSLMLRSIALIIVYLAAAKVGLTFAVINNSATLFWPPGGIALAAVLLGGTRYLPAVFIAACLASVMVNAPLIFGLGSAMGNVLETYLGYILLKRASSFNPKFHHISDLITVLVLGAMIPAIASATLGPLTMLASGMIHTDLLPNIMWRWWKSDVLGIVFFTPLILVFATDAPFLRNSARLLELTALWLAAIILGTVIFLDWLPVNIIEYDPHLSWLFPIVIWAGLRTGKRNTALIQLLFISLSLVSANLNVGVFDNDFTQHDLSQSWTFSMLLASVGMGFAIMSARERHAARKNKQHAKLFEIGHEGVMFVDAQNNILSVNTAFTNITGYTADEVIGKNPRLLSSGRQNHEFYVDMWTSLLEMKCWQGEIWNRHKDGSSYLERLMIHALTDNNHAIEGYIAHFSDITVQHANQQAIAHQAQHDFLTNLPNRLLFSDRFEQQLAFAKRHHAQFAIIYLDLDKFKPVNDTLGHLVGDNLLIAVAERLSKLVREIDTVSRFGGDEFAILVSEINTLNDATILASKVIHELSQPFMLDEHTINISASLGIAMYPEHGTDMDTLIRNADTAMYQAKRDGHNTYVIAKVN